MLDDLVDNISNYKSFMTMVQNDWSNDINNHPNNIIGKLKTIISYFNFKPDFYS